MTRSWIAKWLGIAGIAGKRTIGRGRGRVGLAITGVAVAIAILVVVSGLALGMAVQTAVHGDEVNYVLLPETAEGSSAIAAPDNPQFGQSHQATAQLLGMDGVSDATPVLFHIERVETSEGDSTPVLVLGVVPDAAPERVGGLSTTSLSNGTTFYDNGSYAGEFTGEAVLSSGGAEILGTDEGATVPVGENEVTITSVVDPDGANAITRSPVLVMHLAELQASTGFDEQDQSHQFLIVTDSPVEESQLESLYPAATLNTQTGLIVSSASDTELPLALGGTALVVSLVIGFLFVTTTMGLEVVADRRQLATLTAIGVAGRSRIGLISMQTLLIAIIGGFLGVMFGYGGIHVLNWGVSRITGIAGVAVWHVGLLPYGIVVSLLIGLAALPYLARLVRQGDRTEGVA